MVDELGGAFHLISSALLLLRLEPAQPSLSGWTSPKFTNHSGEFPALRTPGRSRQHEFALRPYGSKPPPETWIEGD